MENIEDKQKQIIKSLKMLKDNEHFSNFLEFVELMRDSSLCRLQTPEVIGNTNLHFTVTGQICCYDGLLAEVRDIQNG